MDKWVLIYSALFQRVLFTTTLGADILSPLENLPPSLNPVVRCSDNGLCSTPNELRRVESRARATHRRFFSSNVSCSNDTAVLFVRSADSHYGVADSLTSVISVNEDDCLFICLRNKDFDSRAILCAFVEYDIKQERCTISSEPRSKELTSRTETTFYEKICVSDGVSSQCSGAAVERRTNFVIAGFMRDTATTRTPEECIEKCVTAERELGFQCLSTMFYYEETVLNCILNDASVRTNPESVAEESSSIVDYFGVDDCYGLPEVVDTRQRSLKHYPLMIEDDVIGGTQTPG